MKLVISSGHGKYIRGAADILDEVDEARRVVEQLANILSDAGTEVITFHDDKSTTQSENLDRIVDFHNSQQRDLDVSVHFNAYEHTSKPMGTECLYITQAALAGDVAKAISLAADLPNRGPKKRTDLAFLNGTHEPAVLIEVCFVDSTTDADHYKRNFEEICQSIAEALTGDQVEPLPPPGPEAGFHAIGKCSWFGGPQDTGVSPSEGLAFIFNYDDAPHLFLKEQPSGTTGLARRLNSGIFYVACRWDYDETPKEMLADPSMQALVRANGKEFLAWPADWGPHGDTDRIADLSRALMDALGLETDDEVEVIYPAS
jgi:N-acetylmuramoyl-L-alanine amidase-like protein